MASEEEAVPNPVEIDACGKGDLGVVMGCGFCIVFVGGCGGGVWEHSL